MGAIRVREVLASGDGQPLPSEVIVEGLVVPEPGTYDILNALVHSNGALRLQVDSATRIVPRASWSGECSYTNPTCDDCCEALDARTVEENGYVP
jgi:hypothetical protein